MKIHLVGAKLFHADRHEEANSRILLSCEYAPKNGKTVCSNYQGYHCHKLLKNYSIEQCSRFFGPVCWCNYQGIINLHFNITVCLLCFAMVRQILKMWIQWQNTSAVHVFLKKVTDSYMTAILFTISMNFSWSMKKLGYIKYFDIKPIARSL